MIDFSNIPLALADETGDILEVLVLVVVVVISIIVSAIKRTMAKGQEQKEAEARGQRQQQARQPEPRQPRPQQRPAMSQTRWPVPQPPRPKPVPPAMPSPLSQTAWPEALGTGVETEVRRQQELQRQEETRRQKRLKARKPPEADTAAIERDLGVLRSQDAPTALRAGGAESLLGSPEQLRLAVIHREILSPPKALQNSPELWDV